MEITKMDRTVHKLQIVAICVASFCWGWNSGLFKKNK